jgi:MacB-like periplasmic core domain
MTTWIQDVAYAFRSLRKRPGFASAALVTITVGIGANVTVFTLVNAMLLRPLPFGERSDRVMLLYSTHRMQPEDWGWGDSELSYPDLLDLRAAASLEGLSGYLGRNFTLTGETGAERVQGSSVTPDLFGLLGIEPMLGRRFLPEDAVPPGLESVVILTHGLWQRRYGADAGIIRSRRPHRRIRACSGVVHGSGHRAAAGPSRGARERGRRPERGEPRRVARADGAAGAGRSGSRAGGVVSGAARRRQRDDRQLSPRCSAQISASISGRC